MLAVQKLKDEYFSKLCWKAKLATFLLRIMLEEPTLEN